MRIAVLSLTRDRLAYTQACFASLEKFAGCDYDHFVLDQGSTDGTEDWLDEQGYLGFHLPENIGINRGMNRLVALSKSWSKEWDYDVIVKFDNDCELLQPNTLRDVCELALDANWILSPRILGLNNPPPVLGEWDKGDDGEVLLAIPQIGGIFQAVPAYLYEHFRYDDTKLLDDDVDLCWWWRNQGGRCGYVKRLAANHFETTSGQHARYPDYFARTLAEGKPAL